MGPQAPLRERSSQWKGGRYKTQAGYVYVMIDLLDDARATLARQMTQKAYVLEHRVNAAAMLGRPLTRAEVVHHRDGVKDHNEQTNLLVTERRTHSLEHREVERRLRSAELRVIELEAEVARLKSGAN